MAKDIIHLFDLQSCLTLGYSEK